MKYIITARYNNKLRSTYVHVLEILKDLPDDEIVNFNGLEITVKLLKKCVIEKLL